jgi:hypothetical protein
MDFKELDNFLEVSETTANVLLTSILDNIEIDNKIIVSDSIYTDTKINEWAISKVITRGGKILMDKIIKNPINDIDQLLKRQNVYYDIFNYQLETLKNNEIDLLWIMNLKKEIDDDISINLLFPSTYLVNKLNNYRIFLDGYHLYKIYILPLSCFIYPLSIILGPYFYLNKYMHLNLNIQKYFKILFEILKIYIKPTGDFKKDLFKIISFLIYIAIYIYSIYQTFILSLIIYKTRDKLIKKIKGLVDFIKTAINIIKRSKEVWKPFFIYNHEISIDDVNKSVKNLQSLNYDISTIYKLWKNENYKSYIITILKVIYTIDIINTISKLKKNSNWSLPIYYDKDDTKIWGVKNPLLDDTQVSNPVSLNKNLIITGVNAGGKTTYVKSIASNIILAQTFGIINATKGNIHLYDAIISFMRVSDEVGVKSYFEAETDCCNKIIQIANELTKINKRGLFILDEPMHSTPPIEGMSVAYSIAKYLGNLNGIRIIITTHFHNLMDLEEKYEDTFINICVNAKKGDDDKYKFDYRIHKGGSKQTIAIELLKKQKFNDEIILSAIEIKNKLCNQFLRNDI